MALARVLALVIVAAAGSAQTRPTAVRPWFTEAEIADSLAVAQPEADRLPAAPGTAGQGVRLARPVPVENPLLQQADGLIGFWIRPDWNGDDGQVHRLLRIGDPQENGLLLEKAATGMLRFVMASPQKRTAARADVSRWRAGTWHHVVIAWHSREGQPLGLPLWIDRVAAAGPVAGGNTFLDPQALPDRRVWIGDETSAAVLDELIFRDRFDTEGPGQMTAVVYRDYFRTAPYSAVRITPEALRVRSDRRVVAGQPKQFGLLAELEGAWVPVTDYAVRYGQWAEFDAKPLIRWTSADGAIATVDANGLVTGQRPGRTTLSAEFRGLRSTYEVEVVPVDLPDLDLLYVARLPRLPGDGAKWWPEPGEQVASVACVENYGFQPVPAGVAARFELLPETNGNYRPDADETALETQEQRIAEALEPRQKAELRFRWAWRPEPLWVRVTLDPDDRVPELCEANNRVCELSTARPLSFAYSPARAEPAYTGRQINHIGSFSYCDWLRGQMERFELLIREQVYPTTSPRGIEDSYRFDGLYLLAGGEWEAEPWVREERFYDGGFPVNEPVNLMAVDAAILHEFGHTVAKLPDLYGYPVHVSRVLLKDEHGADYAGGPLLPVIDRFGTLALSQPNGVPCGVGYDSLMNHCHLWLHPAHAGQVQYFRGYRGERFWGVQGRLIPFREQIVQVYDIDDRPLPGAAVYVYHVTQTTANDAGTKYFHDRPKFLGQTDADGRFRFPGETDPDWDDPDTDAVEHGVHVWNPFGRAFTLTGANYDTAFTPNVWQVEGLLLLKIVSGAGTEFAWLTLVEFNEAFFRGDTIRGIFPVRTSLIAAPEPTPLVRQPVPEAIRTQNLRPVAVAPTELTLRVGEEFEIDGSQSRDPEGQPLIYRWQAHGPGVEPPRCNEPVYRGRAPKEPREFEIVLLVIDGLRVSEPARIQVQVVAERPPQTRPAAAQPEGR